VLVDYFKGMYRQRGENMEQLVMLDRLTFLTISGDAQIRLVQIPTALEIFSCLREMSLDKASGPDGFTVRFLVREWEIIRLEVVRKIQEAFHIGHASKSWMFSHLVLIPNVDNPSKPSHF
jgi:hypothetical protein